MEQKEIVFVTTNKGKIVSAQKYLKDIRLIPYNAELVEPRSDDIREIARQKVLQAYKIVGKPCIAVDAGFFIHELNDFPRAYVNFTLETIGIDGILKLMEDKTNRSCEFRTCLTFFDGNDLTHFEDKAIGTIAEQKIITESERKWSELWYIFIPDGFNKTLGEFSKEDFKKYDTEKDPSCIYKFGQWYTKEYKKEINFGGF